jgi:hypothetical protein
VAAPFCDLAGNAPDDRTYPFGNLRMPRAGEIVINEVLFNPYSGGADFVEIYNRSGAIFDLRQVKLANRDKNNKVASAHAVLLQHFLYPDDYAVFTTELEAVQQFYHVRSPEKVIELSSLPSYPDDAGCVVLLSTQDDVIDEFTYTAKMHSGFIAKPEGISLERINPERASNEPANWYSAAQSSGFATPTYRNSQYNDAATDNGDEGFSFPYTVFSPDGDGYNDLLFINYRMPEPGYVANITVFDAQGRLVREVVKKSLLGNSGGFSWDGSRYDSHKASVGIYILFIEYFDLQGNVKQIKKTCAIAGR